MRDQPLIDIGHGRFVVVADVAEALSAVGVRSGDAVMIHSRLFTLGRPVSGLSREEYCRHLIDLLLEMIGDTGTLIAPTWTYTFRRDEIFDAENTPAHPSLGPLSETVRKHPRARRSVHPHVSVAAIGKHSEFLVDDVAPSSFGKDSMYDRLHQYGAAKFLTIGLGIPDALTYLHYVEQAMDVVYRYEKRFNIRIRAGGGEYRREFYHFATVFDRRDVDANFERFEAVALERGLAKRVPLGHGFVQTIDERTCFDLAAEMLDGDPTALLRITPSSPYTEYIRVLTRLRGRRNSRIQVE